MSESFDKRFDVSMIECIETMTEKIGDISDALKKETVPDIEIVVFMEVSSALEPILSAILEFKNLAESLGNSKFQ